MACEDFCLQRSGATLTRDHTLGKDHTLKPNFPNSPETRQTDAAVGEQRFQPGLFCGSEPLFQRVQNGPDPRDCVGSITNVPAWPVVLHQNSCKHLHRLAAEVPDSGELAHGIAVPQQGLRFGPFPERFRVALPERFGPPPEKAAWNTDT